MSFDFTLLKDWQRPDEVALGPGFSVLAPEERMLLTSDGSLTLQLEALLNAPIGLEVKRNVRVAMSAEEASWLSEEPLHEATEREVWLISGARRLVYAHSVISRAEQHLGEALDEGLKPLGALLVEREIPVLKKDLRIAVVSAAAVAAELAMPADTLLAARRYRLVKKKAGGDWIIKARVFEVFSPELVKVSL